MNPLTALPTRVRKWIYVFYATLGITFGATQVGFATAGQDQPTGLLVAFGVFGYLGTALGLVAAANTAPVDDAQIREFERLLNLRNLTAEAIGREVNKAARPRPSRPTV